MSDPVRDLTQRLARLEAEVESLREENRSLQGRATRPGPRTSPAEPRSRRAFLARAGAVAAGAAERVKDEEYRALVQQYRWR